MNGFLICSRLAWATMLTTGSNAMAGAAGSVMALLFQELQEAAVFLGAVVVLGVVAAPAPGVQQWVLLLEAAVPHQAVVGAVVDQAAVAEVVAGRMIMDSA